MTEIPEEVVNMEDMSIGEDRPQTEPKKVLIEDFRFEEVDIKGKISDKLVLIVKHPDITEKNIEISGAKYQFKDKLKTSGLWVKRDNDNKIPYSSAVAILLRFLNKTSIKELKGEQVDTTVDDQNYLLIKAY